MDSWWKSLDLYYKYGNSPRDLHSLARLTLSKFQKIHTDRFFPFDSLTDVVTRLGLEQELASTASGLLKFHKIGVATQKDLATPWTRDAYGLNLDTINGLAAMILLGSEVGMETPSIRFLMEEMARVSDAQLHLSETVSSVSKHPSGGWVINSRDHEPFDSVIIAAPLKVSGIAIQGEDVEDVPTEPDYVPVHVTLFESTERLEWPDNVLSTLSEEEYYNLGDQIGSGGVGKAGFYSISLESELTDSAADPPASTMLYKIVSPEEIKDSFLESLVRDASSITFVNRHMVFTAPVSPQGSWLITRRLKMPTRSKLPG